MQLRTLKIGAWYSVARQVRIVCAMTAVTPSVRRKVDLPDMFEPVTSTPLHGPSSIVFGTASARSG